ncbi:MAG: c-type cytochrome [Bdellovibrionales bacterium]|nr:c-type cytochrome [Bdellovibrionales bacterium]
MTKKMDELLDSNYDGIKEYDNDLPRWWLYLFYITIAFSAFYIPYYHFGPGIDGQPHALLDKEMKAHQAVVAKNESASAASSESVVEIIQAAASDPTKVAHGKEIFVAKCVACHAQNGEGLVGPNLTDNAWIHGGTIADIVQVVENGVLEKGMLPWKGVLKTDELNDVVAFVWSIRNTNVPGKAPEGDVVAE